MAKAGSHEGAVEAFRRAIDTEPTYAEAFRALSRSYVAQQRKEEAAATLARLLQFEDEPRDRDQLGELLLDLGQPGRALAEFSLSRRREPEDTDAVWGMIRALRALQLTEKATALRQRAHEEHPTDVRFQQ
jgi:tetratricopeptide (TPR) repeat protein